MIDAVVIGGGHNGLVAAAYLARASLSVRVLERLPGLGGAAVSASPFEGHADRLSRYSYLVSLFPDRIARDLGIRVELRRRRVSAYAPEGLLVTDPPAPEGFPSPREHAAWVEFHGLVARAAARLFPTLLEPLPDARAVRALVGDDAWRALVDQPLGDTLREFFADPLVRGVVGTDGLIGTFASLDESSLRQNRCFLWHVIGGPWRVPVGGMGALSDAIAASARTAGADLRCGANVVHVDTGPDSSDVTWIEDGREHTLTARWVFDGRPPADAAEGSQTKLNMLLDRLPRLRSGIAPEEAFAGTFRLHESDDELAAAHADANAGRLPERPPAELYCHTLTDRSILAPDAPPGRQTLTLFGLHTPTSLFDANNAATRAELTDRYLDALDQHLADPIRDCLARDSTGRLCVEAKTPIDLERQLGLPRGNIFHGDLDWPWSEGGGWGAETAHPRALNCGASALRGGGVSGIAGHNAAMAVLDRRG